MQEALDVEAARGTRFLGTQNGEQEYLLWSLGANGYDLTIVDVGESSLAMSGGTTGTPTPPLPSVPAFRSDHPAFRFLRMSRLAGDLFDAYRNAYLAFECLISQISPKGRREPEADWIYRVVTGPPAVLGAHVTKADIQNLYDRGRLPLFHAKSGRFFKLAQSVERAEVQEALATLHLHIAAIIGHLFGPTFPTGPTGITLAQISDRCNGDHNL